jgi:hypothetical protein
MREVSLRRNACGVVASVGDESLLEHWPRLLDHEQRLAELVPAARWRGLHIRFAHMSLHRLGQLHSMTKSG